jgi:hypothetical protein
MLRTVEGVDRPIGVAYAPLDGDAFEIQLIVRSSGANGCNEPTFSGFSASGQIMVANIERHGAPPSGEECLITRQREIDVKLARSAIPAAVTHLALSEHCGYVGCADSPIAFP